MNNCRTKNNCSGSPSTNFLEPSKFANSRGHEARKPCHRVAGQCDRLSARPRSRQSPPSPDYKTSRSPPGRDHSRAVCSPAQCKAGAYASSVDAFFDISGERTGTHRDAWHSGGNVRASIPRERRAGRHTPANRREARRALVGSLWRV